MASTWGGRYIKTENAENVRTSMASAWGGRYIKTENAENVQNAEFSDSTHTYAERLNHTNSDMYLDVKSYDDSQQTVHYNNVENLKCVSNEAYSDVFPENNVDRLVTVCQGRTE
jgi:hypothetical protein